MTSTAQPMPFVKAEQDNDVFSNDNQQVGNFKLGSADDDDFFMTDE
jgi:hypothetical protein